MKKALFEWILPIKTISEANCSEHWAKKSKRHNAQKFRIWAHFKNEKPKINLPCKIKLTRYGKRMLDSDNLLSAFKWIRDEISAYIIPGLNPGKADDDTRIKWEYKQKIGKTYEVGIEIF